MDLLENDNDWKSMSFYLYNKFVDEGYISQLKYLCAQNYTIDDFKMKRYKPTKEEMVLICDETSSLYDDLIKTIEYCEKNKCENEMKRILTLNNHIIITKII